MGSCCQQTILVFDMQNSARFLKFHFTHYPLYQKTELFCEQQRRVRRTALIAEPSIRERKTEACSKIFN